jgi:hypothetical protein
MMQTSSAPQYETSDAEKCSPPSSQGSGDAIIDIDSRDATIFMRNSDLKASEYLAAKDTTQSTEYKLSAAEIEEEIRETITIPCMHTSMALILGHTKMIAVEKYQEGYPRQAAFQSSEPSFSIYRGFNYLHSRVILELQDELRCLEGKLAELDEMDLENGDGKRLKSRDKDLMLARREGTDSIRAGLISTIRSKLISYGTFHGIVVFSIPLTWHKTRYYLRRATSTPFNDHQSAITGASAHGSTTQSH